MPFYHRVYGPGELQFITTSTYRRTPLFLSDRFRGCFVQRLEEVRSELPFLFIGEVLMPEHFRGWRRLLALGVCDPEGTFSPAPAPWRVYSAAPCPSTIAFRPGHRLAKAAEWGYTEPMQITVELPKDIAQCPDPAREALEALAIEGYRSGALTSFETRRLLDFETRYELDGFLKAHNVWEHAYNVEDFNRDCQTLQSLENKRQPESEPPA